MVAEPVTKRATAEPPPLPRTAEELRAAKERATQQRKAKRAAAPVSADEPSLLAKIAALEAEGKRKQTRIRNLEAKVRHIVATQKGTPITKDTHRLILSCLHPDRAANDPKMQKRLERAFQAFTAIAYIFPPDQE